MRAVAAVAQRLARFGGFAYASHLDLELVASRLPNLSSLELQYAPRRLGILREFASPSPLTALSIVTRIIEARDAFKRRHDKKSVAEAKYVANKASVAYVEEG